MIDFKTFKVTSLMYKSNYLLSQNKIHNALKPINGHMDLFL